MILIFELSYWILASVCVVCPKVHGFKIKGICTKVQVLVINSYTFLRLLYSSLTFKFLICK